ncbi:MAG: hypothetical protein GX275_07935 [Clostridiales bacterium]|nr:hypothetical protein [Clostridiales bacterium]
MKILKIVLCVIVLLIVFGVIIMKGFINCVEETKEPKEVVIDGSGDKKALIIYQDSKFGTTNKATMALANKLKEEGYTVIINYPSDKINYSIEDYEVVALGSPVYAGQVSKALLSYLENTDLSNKKVFAFVTGANEDNSAALKLIKDKIKGSSKIVEASINAKDVDNITSYVKELS